MKKHILSILALLLALGSLAISIFTLTALRQPLEQLEEQIAWQNERNQQLLDRISSLEQQLSSSETVAETVPEIVDIEPSCSLFVESWEEQEGALVLTTAYVHVMLPQDAAIESTQLVLYLNGTETERQALSLIPGEVDGSYELTLTDTPLALPETQENDCLDLQLEVNLSDGTQLLASGVSWYRHDGALYDLVG